MSHSAPPPATANRQVDLFVVTGEGHLLGRLPTFTVPTPWWQDLEPIVERHPDLVVLRLLDVQVPDGQRSGGRVSYLVESETPPPGLTGMRSDGGAGLTEAALGDLLTDHPLRMSWARPGGPAADLAWAAGQVQLTGRPRQIRSWNLSSIWSLPTPAGTAWLKCVPPFFAHEASAIRHLGPSEHLPSLIAAEGRRLLMEQMPGQDGYGAGPTEYRAVIDALLQLQSTLLSAEPQFDHVVPHWSPATMGQSARTLLRARRQQLRALVGDGPADALEWLLEGWDQRWQAVGDCGLPDVVFHGDLHPGNARVGVESPVIFDWGDCGWGHPLLDLGVVSAYHQDRALVTRTVGHWLQGWRRLVPGSEPERAWELLRPVARLRTALVFQSFVDNIEPSERVYHDADVPDALARASGLVDS